MHALCPFTRQLTVALCHAEQGRWALALERVERLLAPEPEEVVHAEPLGRALVLRGVALLRLGRAQAAWDALTLPETRWCAGELLPEERRLLGRWTAEAALAAGRAQDQAA